ncbi:hypothetical protein C2S51_034619 [Perilla frutescens var. frutescens]|nr:hypothetical protein C2S51_034619 [Perilla frutescens var. frutescens]
MAAAPPPTQHLHALSIARYRARTWNVVEPLQDNLVRWRIMWRETCLFGPHLYLYEACWRVIYSIPIGVRDTAITLYYQLAVWVPFQVDMINFEVYIAELIQQYIDIFRGIHVIEDEEENQAPPPAEEPMIEDPATGDFKERAQGTGRVPRSR